MHQRALQLIVPLKTLTGEQEEWIREQARDKAASTADKEGRVTHQTKMQEWVEVDSDEDPAA